MGKKDKQRKLTPDQVREMMEQPLKAKKIPSKKKYKRNRKHKKEDKS